MDSSYGCRGSFREKRQHRGGTGGAPSFPPSKRSVRIDNAGGPWSIRPLVEDFIRAMTCDELAARIGAARPQMAPSDVARLCLLILSQCDDPSELSDPAVLVRYWNAASYRLEAATDQHAAVAEELEALCRQSPQQVGAEHVATLLRAVKVQSQVLDLYTEQPALA